MDISRLLISALLVGVATSPARAQKPEVKHTPPSDQSPPGEVQLIRILDTLARTPVLLKTARDGHLLLLRVDRMGYVRVLYPFRPGDSDTLAGGEHDLASLGGNRETAVHGFGDVTIIALWAPQPLPLRRFVQYGHWAVSDLVRADFRQDPERAATNLVRRLGPTEGLISAAIRAPYFGLWSRDVVLGNGQQADPWLRRDLVKDFTDLQWRKLLEEWQRQNVQH